MITKLEIAKRTVSVITGLGASKIVSTIVKNNVPTQSIPDTVMISAGSYALGAMVGDLASRYTDVKIDQFVDWWQQNVKKDCK